MIATQQRKGILERQGSVLSNQSINGLCDVPEVNKLDDEDTPDDDVD